MEADNAHHQAHKEIEQRYDFKGTGASIAQSGDKILMKANSEERVKAIKFVAGVEPFIRMAQMAAAAGGGRRGGGVDFNIPGLDGIGFP